MDPGKGGGVGAGGEVLHRTEREQQDRRDDGYGQQDAYAASHQVDPEVPDPVGAVAGEAADQRHRTAMPTAADAKFCTASPAI